MKHEEIIRSAICVFAMDGRISKQEQQFLDNLRTRLGVSEGIVTEALQDAQKGKGRVHLSQNPEDMRHLLDILVQAAVADGTVAPQERTVLDAVAAKVGVSKTAVEKTIRRKLKQANAAKPRCSKTGVTYAMSCPKCGFAQKPGHATCIRCGILFRRFLEHHAHVATDSSKTGSVSPPAAHKTSPESQNGSTRQRGKCQWVKKPQRDIDTMIAQQVAKAKRPFWALFLGMMITLVGITLYLSPTYLGGKTWQTRSSRVMLTPGHAGEDLWRAKWIFVSVFGLSSLWIYISNLRRAKTPGNEGKLCLNCHITYEKGTVCEYCQRPLVELSLYRQIPQHQNRDTS